MKFCWKFKRCLSRKCIWKCHLENGGHFAQYCWYQFNCKYDCTHLAPMIGPVAPLRREAPTLPPWCLKQDCQIFNVWLKAADWTPSTLRHGSLIGLNFASDDLRGKASRMNLDTLFPLQNIDFGRNSYHDTSIKWQTLSTPVEQQFLGNTKYFLKHSALMDIYQLLSKYSGGVNKGVYLTLIYELCDRRGHYLASYNVWWSARLRWQQDFFFNCCSGYVVESPSFIWINRWLSARPQYLQWIYCGLALSHGVQGSSNAFRKILR